MGMLELRSISKTFNPGSVNEKKALDGLSLTLEAGDFVTIVGSNGAGKSTLFNAIAVIVGSILYRLVYALVLRTPAIPIECLKLVTAIVVGLAIAAPTIQEWAALQARKRRALAARKGDQ